MFDLRLSRGMILMVLTAILIMAVLLLSSVQLAGAANGRHRHASNTDQSAPPLGFFGAAPPAPIRLVELLLGQHRHAQLLGLVELAAGLLAGDDVVVFFERCPPPCRRARLISSSISSRL